MKTFHKRGGGGSLGFHTLIQISYILLYMSSFTVKIWIRISQIQYGGGGEKLGIKLNSAKLQLGLGLSLAKIEATKPNDALHLASNDFSIFRLMMKKRKVFLWWCRSLIEQLVQSPNHKLVSTTSSYTTCLRRGTVSQWIMTNEIVSCPDPAIIIIINSCF